MSGCNTPNSSLRPVVLYRGPQLLQEPRPSLLVTTAHRMRKHLHPVLLAGLLAGCASMLRGEEPLPNPPSAPGQGVVFLFNGLTFPFEGVAVLVHGGR